MDTGITEARGRAVVGKILAPCDFHSLLLFFCISLHSKRIRNLNGEIITHYRSNDTVPLGSRLGRFEAWKELCHSLPVLRWGDHKPRDVSDLQKLTLIHLPYFSSARKRNLGPTTTWKSIRPTIWMVKDNSFSSKASKRKTALPKDSGLVRLLQKDSA